jgi:DNA-binding NarL/FixJ family response regulator
VQHHFTQYFLCHRTGIPQSLPERQQQILEQLLRGDGEKQIARHLGLSIHTVHTYIRRLYLRLNVSSRSELFRACYTQEGQPLFAPPEVPIKQRKTMR